MRPKPVDLVKEVEVIEEVKVPVKVPRYVYIEGPRTIIRPKYVEASQTVAQKNMMIGVCQPSCIVAVFLLIMTARMLKGF